MYKDILDTARKTRSTIIDGKPHFMLAAIRALSNTDITLLINGLRCGAIMRVHHYDIYPTANNIDVVKYIMKNRTYNNLKSAEWEN